MEFAEDDYCRTCHGPWPAHLLDTPRSVDDRDFDFVVFCPDDVDVHKWDDANDEWGVRLVGYHWHELLARLPQVTSPAAALWLLADYERREGKHTVTAHTLRSVDLMDKKVREVVGPNHSVGATKCEACPPGWPATHSGCEQSRPTVHAVVIDRIARRALTGSVNWLDQGGLREVYSRSSTQRIEVICEVCWTRTVDRGTWTRIREKASEHSQWAPSRS